MKRLVNRHLLFREWIQNGYLMVLTGLVLAFGLSWYTLLWLVTHGPVADLPYLPPEFTPATYWAHDLVVKLAYMNPEVFTAPGFNYPYNGYPGWGTFILLMVLGVTQMAGERYGRKLEHLLALPVTRDEIVLTKFAAGLLTLTLGTALGLVITGIPVLFLPTPPGLTLPVVAQTYLKWWSVFLTVYALAFLAGTMAGNWRSAVLCCAALELAPFCLALAAVAVLMTLGVDPGRRYLWQIFHYGQLLTPVVLVQRSFGWESTALMLLTSLAALAAAVWVFHVAPFEKNGEFFAFGNSHALQGTAFGAVAAVVVNWTVYRRVLGGKPNWLVAIAVLIVAFAAAFQATRFVARKGAN
jgi:ABC-type transport system involved in multi-copper enzyme maturation permease subunit